MRVLPRSDRGLRRLLCAMLLTAAALLGAGLLTDAVWLLGIGAWVLIAAVLVETALRP
ncbi:hypothetical protein QMA61_29635 [Streptomyces coelicoflavus]|uniref:hypothetical protein n=1 Tax=Streptomyces coelicoflavus TaxID=285562 RepID=UPI0024ACB274|nr:hypothetical protein [Streptomyces coelicoflavus]MDI6520342.1 hypothetical protein [Streptomyces coelicoflavus]